jgi:hypothetical protein
MAALLSGCKKNIDNNDAVKQGINTYLSKRSDLLSMDVNVTSVAYRDNEATATVRFQAKNNSSPNAGMTMEYVLERNGNNWVVKGRAGGDAHTGMPQGAPGAPGAGQGSMGAMPNTGSGSIGAMPGGAMPGGAMPGASGQTLPPGHPAIGGAAPSGSQPAGALPPGHPQIPEKK